MRNLITDVPGIWVGNATDLRIGTGVTVVLCEAPAVAAVDVRGGGPGTRETDLLDPAATVEQVDAICLSGGSAFGLDAASGVMAGLAQRGRGYAVGPARVPIVPGAILFDLLNGGDKGWEEHPPYHRLGRAALEDAEAGGLDFALGSAGAGTGCTTATVKGGLGSASALTATGHVVGAVVAVNAAGNPLFGSGPHFRAAPYERDAEFGGLGLPAQMPLEEPAHPHLKGGVARFATTLAVVATDAILSTVQARRLAIMAQNGLALSLYPVHTPLDGDVVFALATGRRPLDQPLPDLARLGALASVVLARAVARAVHAARRLPYPEGQLSWQDHFASHFASHSAAGAADPGHAE